MQVFRLVDPGRIDRIIAFDSLPERMLPGNLVRGSADGLPRAWQDFLGVKRGQNALPFYVLDFRTINRDKEKWQEIGNYARRCAPRNFRLLDNLYDMAKPMAPDSYSALNLEPEDIIVVPIEKDPDEQEVPREQTKDISVANVHTDKPMKRPYKKRAAKEALAA